MPGSLALAAVADLDEGRRSADADAAAAGAMAAILGAFGAAGRRGR